MNYTLLLFLRICYIAAFLALPVEMSPAEANPIPNQLIAVEFSLNDSAKTTLGEPLVLRYKITNASADLSVATPVAVEKEDWYSIDLKDANGLPVTRSKKVEPRSLNGLHSESFEILSPANSDEGYLVASQFFAIPHAGKYVLTVHIHASCAPVEKDTDRTLLDVKRAIKVNGRTYTAAYTFPVVVSETDPARLQAVATGIVQKLATETDGKEANYLISALFAMPQDQCLLEWQAVANKPGMDAELIADKLQYAGSIEASDLLLQMLDNPSVSLDSRRFVSEKLAEMYNSGSVALRSHLKATMMHRGMNIPNKIYIPETAD